ncbi:MAG: nucleotide-binding protein [Acidobacteriia bacterium]|nr:nucleotide-binding protein [Terriglobia bacterium]
MARINQKLLERLETKLGLGRRRVYELIEAKVRESHLPRHLAAIAVASQRGINISKFASAEDLAEIRSTARGAAPPPVVVPAASSPASPRSGSPRKRASNRPTQTNQRRRGSSVFVVHGRDDPARRELFTFLRALGLQPIEWNQAIKMTGQGSPYVGTILDTAFREAAAVVVLLTPDDEARLRKDFLKTRDPVHERQLTGQARANVLFEAGMAFGRNPASTVLVQLGEVRPFSDVAGRHVVHLGNDAGSRQELATKLANAGCNVDTSGTDWLSAGDFRSS